MHKTPHEPGEQEFIETARQKAEEGNRGAGPPEDDATSETLMPDNGARSPQEAALPSSAADTELSIIGQAEAGGRYGLDEAELARQQPLDGKTWDGDPNEPLLPETAQDDQALRAARSSEPDSSEP